MSETSAAARGMIVRGALVALPGQADFRRMDVVVRDGTFAALGDSIARDSIAGGAGLPELDARGLMMFPGAIDPHVHFDEPGFEWREDFLHGSSEAARGGVTTVIDMPCTSMPPVTTPANLEKKLAIVSRNAMVDFAFYGGISGHVAEAAFEENLRGLAPRVVGFKCYFISGMESFTAVDEARFARAAALCDSVGRPLLLHAESPEAVAEAERALQASRATTLATTGAEAAGKPTWADYYRSRPESAEIRACERAVALAGTHARALHVVHVGTAAAAELVAAAGASCETCAHYLAFDEHDFEGSGQRPGLGASLKTAPPVKGTPQKALLWKLLADGVISFIASDHAGAPEREKNTGNPLTAYGGIPGTGTMFPYLLSEGLFARRLDLPRFLEATAANAARRYGLSAGKGAIEPGKDADFVLVDPEATTLLDPALMRSTSTITPFANMRLAGRIAGTAVRGAFAHHTDLLRTRFSGAGFPEGCLATPGYGRFITWGYR